MPRSKILITCPKGIPPILKQELSALGFPVLSENIAGVETEGALDDAVRLNLLLRTGHRVLFLLKELTAKNADALYRELVHMPWEDHIPADGYLCVTSSVDNPTIRDFRFANLKCKDAVVDRIAEMRGRRPDSGSDRSRTVVHLFWKNDRCAVYLDTTGEPLSRRGYRRIPLAAPMQETLAAAVILATGWDGSRNFSNPMCGSGTLAIEAALIALNRAPGFLRSNFAFMHLAGFDRARWNELRMASRREERAGICGKIIASDISAAAVDAAKKNAAAAGVEPLIEFMVCDFTETPLPGDGIIVMNPEYGERMGEPENLEIVYKNIGDHFKQKCAGYTGYVFTGNPVLAKKIGLKPKRSLQFFNSGIECRLLEYELYEGSRKIKRGAGANSASARTGP